MRYVLHVGRFLTLTLLLLVAAGCSKNYKLAPVSGRVTMDNRPLANAKVSFYPTGGGKDLPYASGTTDEQGNYKLEAFAGGRAGAGAVVGENRVMISVSKISGTKKIANPKELSQGLDLVPAKYNTDSELKCTVPPEGKQDANFDLKSR
jgi:hypothetical protein